MFDLEKDLATAKAFKVDADLKLREYREKLKVCYAEVLAPLFINMTGMSPMAGADRRIVLHSSAGTEPSTADSFREASRSQC